MLVISHGVDFFSSLFKNKIFFYPLNNLFFRYLNFVDLLFILFIYLFIYFKKLVVGRERERSGKG